MSLHRRLFLSTSALVAVPACWQVARAKSVSTATCGKPVYLTFDTGHMGIAHLVAQVLRKHQIQVSFFAANEPTQQGDGSLGDDWAAWWKARAQEGHAFASHTFDHMYWRADVPDAKGAIRHFRVRPSAGPRANQTFVVNADEYCEEIARSSRRLQQITGQKPLPLFRAPGGKTSPALLAAARQRGYLHVGWSPAGFLGDELPSEQYPNARLLSQALKNIRAGDILLAHLGIWSRKDPWAPTVLEPLITGLLAQGFCFKTLREHPEYSDRVGRSA